MKRFPSLIILYALFTLSSCAEKTAEYSPINERPATPNSIYQLGGEWIDEDARKVDLLELRDKPRLICMIFTSCGSACPTLVHNLQEVESQLSSQEKNKLGIVLVTFDIERDRPARLKQYRDQHKMDPDRWTLLVGNEDKTMELANLLDVRYTKLSGGGFDHSNMISLLNREGEIAYQLQGLEAGTDELLLHIREELKDK